MKAIDVVSGFSRTIVLFALTGAGAFAQVTPPAGTLTVSGVVTTADDAPLPRVRVTVAGAPATESPVLTDSRGQFSVRVPDAARLTFTKTGYVTFSTVIRQGASSPQGAPMRVPLARGGAISGRILDAAGSPMMLATVTARRAGAAATSTELSTTTDDLGDYRFGGLAEGTYTVAARPPANTGRIGGREAALAATIVGPSTNVRPGDENSNINLTIVVPSERPLNPAPVPRTDPPTTGAVRGRVVGRDGRPIAGAQVLAMNVTTNIGRPAYTDASGQYRIDGLLPGDHIVQAGKHGLISREYGQDVRESRMRLVSLRAGQTADSINMTLVRGGAISGTIADEFGEPVEGATVNVLRIETSAGRSRASRQQIVTGGALNSEKFLTDDRGHYRAFALQPGTYVVQVVSSAQSASARAVLPVYYPGMSLIDQATKITVAPDADATAIDLTFKPERAYSVAGTVAAADGTPARVGVLLLPSDRPGTIEMDSVVRQQTDPFGSFAFTNVAPGDYSVQTVRGGSAPEEFAAVLVTVSNTDPPRVELMLTHGTILTGHVRYEGAIERSSQDLTLTASPADRDRGPRFASSTGFYQERDGTFEYRGLFGLNYLTATFPRPGWYLKSIVVNGQDITDAPYDFGLGRTISGAEVVSSAGAIAAGRVTDDRQTPVPDYLVVVFPISRDRWTNESRWVKAARPLQDGTFSIPGLPPGDYWIAAIDRVDASIAGRGGVPDPGVLESLSFRATRISLNEGQTQDVSLRLIRR